MARQKNITALITIGGVHYGATGSPAIINSWTVTSNVEDLDTTVFGDLIRRHEGGLGDGSVAFGFKFDDDLSTWKTIRDLKGTVVAITIKAQNAATSAANPELQFNALVTEVPPLGGDVGTLAEGSVTWPLDTDVTVSPT